MAAAARRCAAAWSPSCKAAPAAASSTWRWRSRYLLLEAQRPAAVRLILQDLAPHQGESLIQVAAPASGHQRIEPVEIDVGLLAIEAVGTGLGQQDPTGQAKACRAAGGAARHRSPR